MFNSLIFNVMMTMVANSTVIVMNNDTIRRANVIANRVGNDVIGIIKAQMIDLLKSKLKNGIAHFIYQKKDGSIREAWGTTSYDLVKANVNGRGIERDYVNCVCYWDVEKGGFRSLCFENLIQVL